MSIYLYSVSEKVAIALESVGYPKLRLWRYSFRDAIAWIIIGLNHR